MQRCTLCTVFQGTFKSPQQLSGQDFLRYVPLDGSRVLSQDMRQTEDFYRLVASVEKSPYASNSRTVFRLPYLPSGKYKGTLLHPSESFTGARRRHHDCVSFFGLTVCNPCPCPCRLKLVCIVHISGAPVLSHDEILLRPIGIASRCARHGKARTNHPTITPVPQTFLNSKYARPEFSKSRASPSSTYKSVNPNQSTLWYVSYIQNNSSARSKILDTCTMS